LGNTVQTYLDANMAELPVARRRLIRLRAPDAVQHLAQRNGAPLIWASLILNSQS
jgi:hypothetical protein